MKEGEISGNLDSPEGGLDAMMQVLVCKVRFQVVVQGAVTCSNVRVNMKKEVKRLVVFPTHPVNKFYWAYYADF